MKKELVPLSFCLKDKIDILINSSANDLDKENWGAKYTILAQVKQLNELSVDTIEHFNFGSSIAESYFLFRIRFIVDISNKMRIKFNNKIFSIKKIVNVEEKNKILDIISLLID